MAVVVSATIAGAGASSAATNRRPVARVTCKHSSYSEVLLKINSRLFYIYFKIHLVYDILSESQNLRALYRRTPVLSPRQHSLSL